MKRHEIENLRRSFAMLSEKSRAPLTRQAEEIISALNETEAELRQLRDGLRQLLEADRG